MLQGNLHSARFEVESSEDPVEVCFERGWTDGLPVVLAIVEAMQRIGGIPEIRWAEVAHPLGSCTVEQLRERAEVALAQFVDIVVAKPD